MADVPKARKFVKKLAASLPVDEKAVQSDANVVSLFENIVSSLDKGPIKKAIVTDLEGFYSIFEKALKNRNIVKDDHDHDSKIAAKSVSAAVGNISLSNLKARILLGDYSDKEFISLIFRSSDNSPQTNLITAVRVGRLTDVQTCRMLMRHAVTMTSLTAGEHDELVGLLSSRLMSRSESRLDDEYGVESAACIWGYCAAACTATSATRNSTSLRSLQLSLVFLCGQDPKFWVLAFGFAGWWGLKGAPSPQPTSASDAVFKLISDYLNSHCTDDADDIDTEVLVSFLSLLYCWAQRYLPQVGKKDKHQQQKNQHVQELLEAAVSHMAASSPVSKGSAKLFWSEVLHPIFVSSGQMDKQTLKSFRSQPVVSGAKSANLCELLVFVGGQQELLQILEGVVQGHVIPRVVKRSKAASDDGDESDADEDEQDAGDDGEGTDEDDDDDDSENVLDFFIDTAGDNTSTSVVDALDGDAGAAEGARASSMKTANRSRRSSSVSFADEPAEANDMELELQDLEEKTSAKKQRGAGKRALKEDSVDDAEEKKPKSRRR